MTRTWDDEEGEVDTKTDAGRRTLPMPPPLREAMVEHKMSTNRAGDDLVFGRTAREPFTPSTVRNQSLEAWGWEQRKLDGRTTWVRGSDEALEPFSPHEARHCAASFFVDMGLTDTQLTAAIGHSDPRTTKLIYAHLLPDAHDVVAEKMAAYFAASA